MKEEVRKMAVEEGLEWVARKKEVGSFSGLIARLGSEQK